MQDINTKSLFEFNSARVQYQHEKPVQVQFSTSSMSTRKACSSSIQNFVKYLVEISQQEKLQQH